MRSQVFGVIISAFLAFPKLGAANLNCTGNRLDFDFIIVGGGTAGVALATRLSQSLPSQCILVIEAGPDGRKEERIYVPGLRGTTFNGPLDWTLPTVPMPEASNRSIIHNRGKVLGGSSALNLLVWDRATVAEYDAWEKLGNPGWNFRNMYDAMLRVENFQRQGNDMRYGTEGVGYGGPVQIGLVENPPEHVRAGIPTMLNLGIEQNLESLNGSSLGTMFQPAMQRFSNHTRSYAVDYLPLAGPNVVFKFNTTVDHVVLDSTNTKATAVLLRDGIQITANKEIILSAGSLLSPTILERSGIGQPAILRAANITPKIDLHGVGENLQDHLRIQTTYQLRPDIMGLDILKYNTTRAALELAKWRRNETSLYQYAGSAYAFVRWDDVLRNFSFSSTHILDLAKQSANLSNPIDKAKLTLLTSPSSHAPDLEIVFSDGYIGTKGYPANGTTGYAKQYASLIAGVMHPFARGHVHVNTSSPAGKPVINPRFLSTKYDLEALKQAAMYTRKIAQTEPFRKVWVEEFDPGVGVQTDAQWEKYARDNVYTFYHPLGTCAMLPEKDGGVVDHHLRVYGVKNLRVVDASVIPMIISAHIQTAVYGIAERAAVFIVEQYQ